MILYVLEQLEIVHFVFTLISFAMFTVNNIENRAFCSNMEIASFVKIFGIGTICRNFC